MSESIFEENEERFVRTLFGQKSTIATDLEAEDTAIAVFSVTAAASCVGRTESDSTFGI